MSSWVHITIATFVIFVCTLGWMLALTGVAGFQNTGEIHVADVGFAWWTIWFQIAVYFPLIVLLVYSFYKQNFSFLVWTSNMFMFLIGILAVMCLYMANMTGWQFMQIHEADGNKNCVLYLQFAFGGFIIMSIQNIIIGSVLSFVETPSAPPMSLSMSNTNSQV